MNKKQFILLITPLIFLFTSTVFASNPYINMTLTYDNQTYKYNTEEVYVAIDGTKLTNLTMPPIILNNYTLVPARDVFEKLGATVQWKKDIEQVYITYNTTLIVIPINSSKAYVNGNSVTLDTQAKIINNKTMIPLRFVSTALGFKINWDIKTRVANIVTDTQTTEIISKSETTTETTTLVVTTIQSTTKQETTSETTTKFENSNTIPQVSVKNENIFFENDTLYIKNTDSITLSDIKEYDNYNNKNYTVEINNNLTNYLSSTTFDTASDKINSCKINVTKTKTTITFNEKKIIAININQSKDYLTFKVLLPKEKYNKIVVIDPGHGGDAPGAIANNLVEKDLTLEMALNLQHRLNTDGTIKCYMTRTTDINPSFDDRTNLANEVGDMFISIHINSANDSSANGTETFCQYANDLGNGLTSYRVAEEMLNQLLNQLGTVNRKVKTNDLIVLRNSKIPASLIEIGFISNPNEANLMSNSINKVGQAIYDGIKNLFNTYKTLR